MTNQIMSDSGVPLDNKQLRLYQDDGQFTRFSVEEVIAQKLNNWKGWTCSAGARNLYIDYDGNVWIANCASANQYGKVHTDRVEQFTQKSDTQDIEDRWTEYRENIIGTYPHRDWIEKNTEQGWPMPKTNWETCEQHIKLMECISELEQIFFAPENLEKRIGDKQNYWYKKFIKEPGTWAWKSEEKDASNVFGLLGSIFNGWEIPKGWVTCPYSSCGCGADVILSKAKNNDNMPLLDVTWNGTKATSRSANYQTSIADSAAVEMNFPIDYQILWDISRNCNFDCSYCWPAVHNNTDKHYDYEVITQTIDKAIEWADGNQIRWNFGGGEPTLHPKFLDILKYLKERKQWTMVTTNGSRTTRYWNKARQYLNSTNFSCHFEAVDLDLFIENIKATAEWHEQVDDDHWIEVKLMTPPGVVGLGIETKERIEALDVWNRPGANGRMKGAVVLVPIRDLEASGNMVTYTSNELGMLQNQ